MNIQGEFKFPTNLSYNLLTKRADLEDFTGFEGGATTAFSSPGAPSIFDMPMNGAGTVSPQDLLVQDPYRSAPNSTALTALTSPSSYESPDFLDSYDISPNNANFGDLDTDSSQWFSLFPDQIALQAHAGEVPVSHGEQTTDEGIGKAEVTESPPATGRRLDGSPTSGRHSSVAGVNPRKRDKPLPPIVVEDPGDVAAMKRARNTLAARKSRERKAQRLDELEEKIRQLEAERDHWKTIALSGGS